MFLFIKRKVSGDHIISHLQHFPVQLLIVFALEILANFNFDVGDHFGRHKDVDHMTVCACAILSIHFGTYKYLAHIINNILKTQTCTD